MSKPFSTALLEVRRSGREGSGAAADPVPPEAGSRPPSPVLDGDVTRILKGWNQGDPEALSELIPEVFSDLRRMARKCMRSERGDHTLEPTALVHELYLRLARQRVVDWQNRFQFFTFASQLMRKILVDHARRHQTSKRGRGIPSLPLSEALELPQPTDVDLESLDEALRVLTGLDPRQSQVVELRFFAGLSVREVQEVLGCSRATVIRDWRTAKLWLLHYLQRG